MKDNDLSRVFNRRTALLAGGKLTAASILLGRLAYLQLIEGDKYKKLSDQNRIRIKILPPKRGLLFDKHGIEIANNTMNYSIQFVPEELFSYHKNLDQILDKINKITPISDFDRKRIEKDLKSKKRFIPILIKDGLTFDEVSEINFRNLEFPGVFTNSGYLRHYPFNENFAHVIGYVSEVTKKELKKAKSPLLQMPGFMTGKDGVEKFYEDTLRGDHGEVTQVINSAGRVVKNEIDKKKPLKGKNLELSLDTELQKYTINRLKGESASVIIMDIYTGEVLVLASTPSFDPNKFIKGISSEEFNALLNDPMKPFINKTINGIYSPGSTFKMITALAALNAGDINERTKYNCKGYFDYGNHRYHCWEKQGHGQENVIDAIKHSCDVFFYETALKTGIDNINKMAAKFGLNDKTGVDLLDEKAGFVPNKEWKKKHRGKSWLHGDTILTGIGQGFVTSTPLQLAVMTARIANGGKAVTPTIIKRKEKLTFKSLDIDPYYLNLVQEGMYAVVNKHKGTAEFAAINFKGNRLAGKTGTSQVFRITQKERQKGIRRQEDLPWKLRNHALFVGFAPYKNPKYAISVVVEHGRSSGATAVPIARDIMYQTLKLNFNKEIFNV